MSPSNCIGLRTWALRVLQVRLVAMCGTDQYRRPRLLAGLDVGLSRPRDARVGLLQQAAIRCGTRSRVTSVGMRRRSSACASATVAGVICNSVVGTIERFKNLACSENRMYRAAGCGSMETPGHLRGPPGDQCRTSWARVIGDHWCLRAPPGEALRRELALGAVGSALLTMHA